MADRAVIVFVDGSKFRTVAVYRLGYIDQLGRILITYYNSYDLAQSLVSNRNFTYVRETLESSDYAVDGFLGYDTETWATIEIYSPDELGKKFTRDESMYYWYNNQWYTLNDSNKVVPLYSSVANLLIDDEIEYLAITHRLVDD